MLLLARRKNRPAGSRIVRKCWCGHDRTTCPVHVLGRWFAEHPAGAVPFAGFNVSYARRELRRILGRLKVKDAESFRTHDLRRGHARDLQESGAPLAEILAAGQ